MGDRGAVAPEDVGGEGSLEKWRGKLVGMYCLREISIFNLKKSNILLKNKTKKLG